MKLTRKDYERRAIEYRIAFMAGYRAGYKQGYEAFSDMVRIIFDVLLKESDVKKVMKIADEELAKLKAAEKARNAPARKKKPFGEWPEARP